MGILITPLPSGGFRWEPVAAGAAAPTPPSPPATSSAPSDDQPPKASRVSLHGFKASLRTAFKAIGQVPVTPRQIMAQALGKETLTDGEDQAVRPSYNALGKKVRDELAAEGIHFDAVWVQGPFGGMEKAFKRRIEDGEMS